MNIELTRKLAVLVAASDALNEAAPSFTETGDLLAHRQFQMGLGEFLTAQQAAGHVASDPIAFVSAEVERIEPVLAEIEVFIKGQMEIGKPVLAPEPFSLNRPMLAEFREKADQALAQLVEQQHKLAAGFQPHDITGREASLDIAAELAGFCKVRRPGSSLLKRSRRDLAQFAHGEGVFHSDVVLHLMGVRNACDLLITRHAEQKAALEQAHALAEAADFARAAEIVENLSHLFTDLPYNQIAEVVDQWKKQLHDVEERLTRIKVQVTAQWRAPFGQPWAVAPREREVQDKLQQFHDFLTKFHISLDAWKNSDFAVEGRRLFKRLSVERQHVADTAAKILQEARKIAIAQLVVAIGLLGLALRFWAVLWPLLVPVAGIAATWKLWRWLHARLVERTTVHFRMAANGRSVEDPQMAVIFLNGLPYRNGMRIPPGTYQLTLDVSLFEPFTRTVTISLGRSNDLGTLPVRLNRQTFINSLDMRFVPVGGLSALFSVWPTRVLDYALFVHALKHPWTRPNFKQDPDHPVVNVTWHDAVAFCDWLTEKERREKKIGENDMYRLPTDLEWSAAVGLERETGATPAERDGQIADVFPWGKQWPPPRNAGNYDPELRVDGFDFTSPVGSFAPNNQGLHDLGGNVWEWCHDFYNGEQKYRTLRGASWRSAKPTQLLSSARLFDSSGHRVNIIGFRVVLEVRRPSPLLQGRSMDATPAATAATAPAQPGAPSAEPTRANPA